MTTLIVEDDFTSRVLLHDILMVYGPVHIAVNGREAVTAVRNAIQEGRPYELICLDIMMPEMDGYQALHEIRALEQAGKVSYANSARIIMTTALGESRNVIQAFNQSCDAYLLKPIDKAKLLDHLREFALCA